MPTNIVNHSLFILVVTAIFSFSKAYGGNQMQYGSIESAKNATIADFRKIQVYTDGMREKINYFKENCKSNIDIIKILPCLSANTFIMARLERIEGILTNVNDVVQNYPAELSALKPGVATRIKNIDVLIQDTKKDVYKNSLVFTNKSEQAFNQATQQAVVDGTLAGKSLYYCTSFVKKIALYDLDYQILKSKNADFPMYYQKYDEVSKFVATAELFKKDCIEKIDLNKASLVLQKILPEISMNKTIMYIKTKCKQIKDLEVKEKCLRSGEKKIDLLYSLFSLEKTGNL